MYLFSLHPLGELTKGFFEELVLVNQEGLFDSSVVSYNHLVLIDLEVYRKAKDKQLLQKKTFLQAIRFYDPYRQAPQFDQQLTAKFLQQPVLLNLRLSLIHI